MTPHSAVRILRSGPARFLFLFTVLMLPWPGLGRAYASAIAELAGAVLSDTSSKVTLQFESAPHTDPATEVWRLRADAEDTATGRYVGTVLDLRRSSYIATAVFAALALATPLRRSRNLRLLLAGLAPIQLLPLLPLLSFFSGKLPVQAFHLGAFGRACIEIGYHALVAPPGMAYALPGLLWLALVWTLEPGCLRLDPNLWWTGPFNTARRQRLPSSRVPETR